MIGYCVKCKSKREMTEEKDEVSKKGLKVKKGLCSTCGTKMCRILGK